jgi:hypothetical protein
MWEIIKCYWLFKYLSVNVRTLVLRVFLNPTRPGYLTRFEVVGKPFNFRVICRLWLFQTLCQNTACCAFEINGGVKLTSESVMKIFVYSLFSVHMLTFSGLIMPFENYAYRTEFRNQYLAIIFIILKMSYTLLFSGSGKIFSQVFEICFLIIESIFYS